MQKPTWQRRHTALVIVLIFAALRIEAAHAVTIVSGPTTTLSDSTAGATGVTYTFGSYRIPNNESVSGISVTFPEGTDVTTARAVNPAGVVSVSVRTVTMTFTTPLRNTTVSVEIGGITNPASRETSYNAGNMTFYVSNPVNNKPRPNQYLATGDYRIFPPALLTLTITTPDDGQSVQFGAVDPGSPSSASLTLLVNSSTPYLITRSLSGDVARLGLSASGLPASVQSAGFATFSDTLTIDVPWTTDPGIPLTANAVYTVTQQ